MAIELDHIILAVNDRAASIGFYTGILGLIHWGSKASAPRAIPQVRHDEAARAGF
jgi:catechol 2,3-dioxygenase-like lactoylglutathione lyase family enzyme